MKKAALLTAITALAVALVAYLTDVLPNPGTPDVPTPGDTTIVTPPGDTTSPPPSDTTMPAPAGAIASDDFTAYKTIAAFLVNVGAGKKYPEAQNTALLSLDTTVRYNGHATLRYAQPAASTLTPQLTASLGNSVDQVRVRYVIRYSPGWTTRGTTSGSAYAYKLLGLGWSGFDGRATIEFTNLSQYTQNWIVKARSGTTVGPSVEMNGPSVVSEWTDGKFHEYVFELRKVTSTTATQTWYLDGVKQTSITVKMTTGSLPIIDRVLLGLNFNSQRVTAQAINVGEWAVYDLSQTPTP